MTMNNFSNRICYIIPSLNSEKTIEKCLLSVKKQNQIKSEIILVDGESSDSTLELAKKIGGVKILIEKKRGPAAARNLGLKNTRARYIVFIDSDCILPKDWTKKCMKRIKNKKIAGVGGPGIATEKTLISESLNLLLYGGKFDKKCFVTSLATMNAFYDRKKIGKMLFNEKLIMAEDPEFSFRVIKLGHNLLFDNKLFVYHNHPTNIKHIVKRWYNYGKYYPLPYLIHKEMINKAFIFRMLYSPLLIFFLISSLIYPIMIIFLTIQLASLFIIYLLIGIIRSKSWRAIPFSIIHSIKQIAQEIGIIRGFLGGR
jgi:glycosyltransferase involved in cell wall biosynthesis